MNAPECPREQQVIAAALRGGWPDRFDDELRAHARDCGTCSEVALLASLLREDQDLLRDASVPLAGQVWWRAAIRARIEASQQAVRPLSWLWGAAVACVLGLGVAGVELLWSPVQRMVSGTQAGNWLVSFDLQAGLDSLPLLTSLAQSSGLFVLGAAAFLVLAPIALYFALSDE